MTEIALSFSPASLRVLNLCLAFIMFGVALSIQPSHFREVLKQPSGILTGILSQWLILPAFTFLLVMALRPPPGLALGMFLVAACPGGNVSNYFSLIGKANVALSVSLTAFSTLFSVIGTPLAFQFWSNRYGPTADLLQKIDISFLDVLLQVLLILTLPVTVGILFARRFPDLTTRIAGPVKHLSFLFLVGFIVVAFYANARQFVLYIETVFGLVLLHNAGALAVGYLAARGAGQSVRNRRSISIETGIQNSGLGLILIFTFFSGHGEMALVAAWWGVWHMIAGMAVAWFFSFQDGRRVVAAQESGA
ncbi:MAG: bile acid:sodium symporter family protein [Gemmatimonadota bacterium]|jgi:BASS family bile acid:Na+ symporter